MQLYPGLYRIDAPFENGRQINLWLFDGAMRVLVDSGVAGVPTASIMPYLDNLGLRATDLDLLINLHAHADHVGGNAELVAASGNKLRLGAHRIDAPGIADHRVLATQIYGLTDEERIQALLRRCGENTPVHEWYRGGEVLDLGGMTVEVIHVPGHTAGNISLFDHTNRALIHGESVMGPSMTNDQGLRSTPFGADPAAYRQGLERVLALDWQWFLSSHREPLDGAAGREFIRASLASLNEFSATLRDALAAGIARPEELAARVAESGRYQAGPRLNQQVANLLHTWDKAGIAHLSPDGGYRLSR